MAAIPADLSRHDECLRLAEQVTADGDGLHILVNNAGATWGEPLESFPDSAWDKVLDLNLKSPFWLVQALLPALREAGTADDPRASSTSAASTASASAGCPCTPTPAARRRCTS